MKVIVCFRHFKCICRKWRKGRDYSWHLQHLLREFGWGPLADLETSVPSPKSLGLRCVQNGPPARREEGAYLNRYVPDEQRGRRPIFNATLRTAASWLFFRVARSAVMIQIAALRSRLEKQPTDLRRSPRDLGDGALETTPLANSRETPLQRAYFTMSWFRKVSRKGARPLLPVFRPPFAVKVQRMRQKVTNLLLSC